MKPLKLYFQAFASYVEGTEVDFEKLDSMFLIHGETGAGKTAILDAMMYALYGESSGEERDNFRCIHPKAAEVPTRVEFTFEIRGKKYKFTRSIELTPRSKNLKYKQDCFYFDENENQFRAFFENPNKEPVRQKAEELTGLSAEQFRKIIILPQGKFERQLISESKEKEEILSTLFAAGKYSRLSDKLYEQAEEERRRVDDEETALNAILAGENVGSVQELAEETEKLSKSLEELSPRLESAKQKRDCSQEELTAAQLLFKDFSDLAKAREQLAKSDSRSAEIEKINGILSLHEKALKIKPAHTALSEAEKRLNIRAAALDSAKAALDNAEREFAEASGNKEKNSSLEKTISEKTGQLTLLNEHAEDYEKIGSAEEKVTKLSGQYSDSEKICADIEASIEKIDKEFSEKTENRNRITAEYSRQLPSLRIRKAELERGAENAGNLLRYEQALKQIEEEIKKLSSEAEALRTKTDSAQKEYTRLHDLYITNTIAELSSQLIEGQPCPVCGSHSHPAPARSRGDAVTSEQVSAALDSFEKAKKELSDMETKIAGQEARIPAANEYISECRRVIKETAYTPEALAEISQKLAEAEKHDASLSELDKQINSLSAQKREAEEKLKKARKNSEELKEQKTKSEAELEALRKRILPECPDRASYTAKTSALKSELEALKGEMAAAEKRFRDAEIKKTRCGADFEQARNEHSEAAKSREEAKRAFAEKLAEQGYSDEKQYENSLLGEELAGRYSAEVKEYSMERHAVEEAVRNLSEKVSGKVQPDIEKLKAAAEEAKRLHDELSRQEAVDSEKLSRLKRLSEEYSKRYADYEAAREKSSKRLAFAKFMRGDKGLSFTRYVLSIMLNMVIVEANRILAEIHGGMFRLCIKSELASNSKQGLDLEVQNTSLSKDVKYGVKDLSGGEKFLISLALSLGLSQVVRSRSGGIQMDSLFIDEGFGSLDTSSLREAVGILCGLSAGRSTIGIISHVDELRNVIPCGVKITKSPENGSRLEIRAG